MTPPPRLILSQLQREQIIGALDDPQTTALAERSSDAASRARVVRARGSSPATSGERLTRSSLEDLGRRD